MPSTNKQKEIEKKKITLSSHFYKKGSVPTPLHSHVQVLIRGRCAKCLLHYTKGRGYWLRCSNSSILVLEFKSKVFWLLK